MEIDDMTKKDIKVAEPQEALKSFDDELMKIDQQTLFGLILVCVLCGFGGEAVTRAVQSNNIVRCLMNAWNVVTKSHENVDAPSGNQFDIEAPPSTISEQQRHLRQLIRWLRICLIVLMTQWYGIVQQQGSLTLLSSSGYTWFVDFGHLEYDAQMLKP